MSLFPPVLIHYGVIKSIYGLSIETKDYIIEADYIISYHSISYYIYCK